MKQTAIKAAKEAGNIQLKNYGRIKYVKDKGDIGLVTNVDYLCEKKIVRIIKAQFPDHNILAEEYKYKKTKSPYKWLIDPIDGTHNYLYGLHIFGVSIALEYKKQVIFGVIYLPFYNYLFIAEKEKGSYLNNKKIFVSKRNKLKNALMNFDGSLNLLKNKKMKFLNKIIDHIFRVRISGCAIWDLACVAMGKTDLSVAFSTKPWDVAAGFLLVEEAGGKVTDLEGKKWNQYMREFVASNGKVHNKVLKII